MNSEESENSEEKDNISEEEIEEIDYLDAIEEIKGKNNYSEYEYLEEKEDSKEKEEYSEKENTLEDEDSEEKDNSEKEESSIKEKSSESENSQEIELKEIKDSEEIEYLEKTENNSNDENMPEKEDLEEEKELIEKEDLLNIETTLYNKNSKELKESTNIDYSSEKERSFGYILESSYMEENEETINITEEINNINNSIKCDISCLTCYKEPDNNNTNCLECNTYKGYYPLYEKNSICIHNETNIIGYYLDTNNISYTWKRCHDNCKRCIFKGNETNMNCLSCKDNLLYIKEKDNCVSNCPNGYETNEINNECIVKQIFDQKTTINEFKNQIMNNISAFVNSSKVINGSNFLAVVLSSDKMNTEEQLKNGISAVDLGNCTDVLKEYYNISKDENLIILNMESKKEENKNESDNNAFNLGKDNHIEVFDFSGNKLDLSVCKEDITIMKYIGDVEELDMESAMGLADKGIDVFNAADGFFNDICHPFDNPDGIDIIITDRRNDIYQNASFCQDGCTYTGVNYDLMAANCICDSSYLQNDEKNKTSNEEQKEIVNFKSITKSFISNLLDFNYQVIYCYNLVLNSKIIFKNIGFYSMSSMFFLQCVFLLIYIAKKLKSLKNYMIIFKNKNSCIINNDINNNNKKSDNKNKRMDNKNNKKITDVNQPPKKDNSIITSLNDKEKDNKLKKINEKKNIKLNMKDRDVENEKNIGNKHKLKNEIKSKVLNIPILFNNKKSTEGKFIISQNFNPTFNIQTPQTNFGNNKSKKNKKKTNLINTSEREDIITKKQNKEIILKNKDDTDKIYNIKTQKSKKRKTLTKKSKKNIINRFNTMETVSGKKQVMNLSYQDSEIQDMDYEEAIIYDKRTYIKMYWSFLVDSQIILGTFCTDNHLNLLVIKLSFFICTFQISFFLNALFYT